MTDSSRRRSHFAVLVVFLAVALLYTGPALLPGRTLAPLDQPLDTDAWKDDPTERVRVSNSLLSDVAVQFIPWDAEILRLARQGELPWVNRYAGDGSPLFANPQTALFSPFTWPRLLLGLDGWALMALMKMLAASLCAFWFARELDIPARQALVSGLVYATAGYSIVWLLYPITGVFALLPGLGAAAMRLMKRPGVRNAALVVVFAALCTAGGHPETLFLGVAGLGLFLFLEADRRHDLGAGAMVPVAVGALLGFLLLAVQIVPFLVILGEGYAEVLRPSASHPFRLWAVASQFFPGILGTPLRGEIDLTALPMAENFNLRAGGFIGAIVLMALLLTWRQLSPTLKRGLIIGAVALALSWYPPGLWSAIRHVPLLRVLTLEYGASLFVLFGALAAGPALALAASRRRHRLGVLLAVAGLLTLAAGITPLVPSGREMLSDTARSTIAALRERGHLRQPAEVYEDRLAAYLEAAGRTSLRRAALPGLCWLSAGLAFALPLPLQRRTTLVSLAAGAELIAFGLGYNPAVNRSAVPTAPSAIEAIRRADPSGEYLIAAHHEVFPANLATLYQRRDVVAYDAMETKQRVEQLIAAGYQPRARTLAPVLSPDQVRVLAGLGVRFVLSRSDVAGGTRLPGPPAPAVGAYELEGAVPVALPPNNSPAGLYFGAIISLLALAGAAGWLRLFTLDPASRDSLTMRTAP